VTAVQVRVTGRVQGVAFRWQAQHEALRLGVTGWVRNAPAGGVVAHVEGEAPAVVRMVA
jgi:acylphosphatase